MYKYETVINIGDNDVLLRFSFKTVRLLEKGGFKLRDIENSVDSNYANTLVTAVVAGAKVGGTEITEDDVDQWVDENGLFSSTVQSVYAMFIESLHEGVPPSKNVQAGKATPQMKTAPKKK